MDFSESTKVVFRRIQKLDPENVSMIIGYLLMKGHSELEMIRLAFGPDYAIQSLIKKVKGDLGLPPKPAISGHVSASQLKHPLFSKLPTKFTAVTPASSCPPLPSAPLPANIVQWIPRVPTGQQLMHNFQYFPMAGVSLAAGGQSLQNQPWFFYLDDQLGSCSLASPYFHSQNYCPELAMHPLPDRRSSSLPHFSPQFPELSSQICDNFRQGYCKYGGNCRFLHIIQTENGYFVVLNPSNTDEAVSHGSLKLLEMEIIELLKTRRGIPVSISSLPMLYYDAYGKALKVERYLTEACEQGKCSGDLTKLLAQMTSCFRVIERPPGLHSIILEEDVPRYMRFFEEINEQDPSVVSSRQVYLTFPPQSLFSKQDLLNYFNSNFGPVQEVRIPGQEKRMFGFLTFVYPETAALVLTKTNPHFVCGAQVLVKPYKHRIDRKVEEKVQHPNHSNPCLPDPELKTPSTSQLCEIIPLLKKELSKENEQQLDLKKKHISGMEVTAPLCHDHTSANQALGGSSLLEGVPSNGCNSEVKLDHIKTFKDDQQSPEELNLPDSPFSFQLAYGISPAI